MGRFHDILTTIEAGEDGTPNPLVAELTTAYDEDFTVANQLVADLEIANAEANTAVAKLQERNAELMLSISQSAGDPANDDNDDDDDITIDDLSEEESN